jgi:hypothetical protein
MLSFFIMKKRSIALNKRGFTFAEIIVSTGIMTAITASLILFFVNAIRLTETNRNMTMATSHVNLILEAIRNTTFANVKTQCDAGQWTLNTNANFTAQNLTRLKNEILTTTCSTVTYGAGLIDVTVNVTWSDTASRSRSILFETLTGGL